MSSFWQTALKVSKIKLGKLKEGYLLGRDLWMSLSDAQKAELLTSLMSILTPEQMIKGTELYGVWKEVWKSEEETA